MKVWPARKFQSSGTHSLVLKSDRVTIRPPDYGDMTEWIKVRRKNQVFLKPYEPRWPDDALSTGFYLRRMARITQDWEEDRAYSFLIFENETNAIAGGINLNHVTRGAAGHATLGYWLDEDHQGQGFMREAGALVLAFAFNGLQLMRVNAGCLPHNIRSQKMLLSLGFEEEGYAKAYFQIDGLWQDHVLYGLTKQSYAQYIL